MQNPEKGKCSTQALRAGLQIDNVNAISATKEKRERVRMCVGSVTPDVSTVTKKRIDAVRLVS